MTTSRKPKADERATRLRLMEAAAQIMHEEGYASATSRQIAARAGVKQALVYYYFPTMDDLFLAVLRAGAEVALEQMRAALTEDNPLRALWQLNSDSRRTVLNSEFVALANHRKVIGVELRAYAERVRDIETAAATMALRANGKDLGTYPPVAIAMLIAQIARSLGNEAAIGMHAGHDELRALVEQYIDTLTTPAAAIRS